MSGPRRTPAAAKYLGVSESFLNKDRSKGGAGRVAFRRVGRVVVYDESDLDDYKSRKSRRATLVARHRQSQHHRHLKTRNPRADEVRRDSSAARARLRRPSPLRSGARAVYIGQSTPPNLVTTDRPQHSDFDSSKTRPRFFRDCPLFAATHPTPVPPLFLKPRRPDARHRRRRHRRRKRSFL